VDEILCLHALSGEFGMRKTSMILGMATLVIASVALLAPSVTTTNSPIPDSHKGYVALFNQKVDAMRSLEQSLESEEGEETEHGRFNMPSMFAEFDKLKRMDPSTGEVPGDGYQRAYNYFVATWGEPVMSVQRSNSNYGLQWDERGPTGIGGRTRAFLWDPNSASHTGVFAGGVGGGLWRTNDVTVNNPVWTQVSPLFSNVAVTCMGYDPTDLQVMYFGTGEGWNNADAIRGAGVWKTTDGGNSWEQLPSTTSNSFWYCQSIVVSNTGVLYVATKAGLYRSDDDGLTMTKVLGSTMGTSNDYITDMDIAGNGDLYAAVSGIGVYKSLASLGAAQGTQGNWTHLTTNFQSGTSRIEISASQSNSNYVYAIVEVNNAAGDVYRTTNGGTSWTSTSGQPGIGLDISNGQAWYDLCIAVDPNDHLTVYVGAIDQYRSANGGSSWTQLTAAYGGGILPYIHADQHNIYVNPTNSNQLCFTNDGGIWYSSNKGTSVSEHNANYNVTQFYSCAIDPRAGKNKIIGGAQDNGSSMVNAPGIGSGISLTGSDGAYVAINALHPDTMYTTTQYATVRRTKNNGATFTSITNANLNNNNTLFINPLEIDAVNPVNLYQGSTALWYHPTAASGSSAAWRQITTTLSTNVTAIAPAYNPSTVVFFAAGGVVYRIANATTSNSTTAPTALSTSGLAAGYINCVMVNPNDNNHIIVTFSSFGLTRRVVECRNANMGAGAVWKDLTGNLPDIPCNWVVIEPNNPNGVLLGTDMGIFRCTDITQPSASIYWSPESMGLGIPRVEQIRARYADKMVFIGTHGRGFFSTNSYNLVPQAAFAALNPNACGGIVQFTDSTANAPVQWAWDFGDGGTSTLQNPTHSYAASGTYTVQLTSTNPNGASTSSQTITINVLTPPTATAAADTSGCPGDTITLGATGGGTYSWSPPNALINPNSANPQFVVTSSRTLIVTVTDGNGCSDTDTMVVTALASPSVWAGADQTITSMGGTVQLQASGAATYVWSPSTGLSCTTCANPVANPTSTTTYTCTGYSAAGCSRSDNLTVFVNIVGLDPQTGKYTFSIDAVAPQPMRDRGTIRFSLPESMNVRIDLIDLSGKRVGSVFEGQGAAGPTQLQWERAGLASGIYFLRMQADGFNAVKKVVLE
jgi:photosystem II stability/assembly factor-like uncharacterized protein